MSKKSKKFDQLDFTALETELKEACRRHFELSLKKGAGALKQTHLLRQSRRDIARLKTLMHVKRSA